MGFPLQNNFSVFEAIRHEIHNRPDGADLKEFNQFNLFAVVLHDPNQDPGFHDALGGMFDDLDHTTGDQLLFFCLTDPPAEWVQHAKSRPYWSGYSNWVESEVPNALKKPGAILKTQDQSHSAFTIAQFMEIPPDELPCLYVTTDFSSTQGITVQSHESVLEKQLQALGKIASRHGADSQDEIYNRIKDELPRYDSSPISHSVNLAVVAEAMSLLIMKDSKSNTALNADHDAAKNICEELYKALISRISCAEDNEELERCLTNLALLIDALHQSSGEANLGRNVEIPQALLDPASVIMLRTGNSVWSFMQNQPECEWDYSPAVMMFAKVFEREINLSLVQWMRTCGGVAIPPYFNKVQDGIIAKCGELDFNLKENSRLRLPSLGQSRRVYEEFLDSHDEGQIPLSDPAKTALARGGKSNWSTLARIRNDSSHAELASPAMAEKVCSIFGEFSKGNLFDDLCKLRGDLNGAAARSE
jgi:hypothetical protein